MRSIERRFNNLAKIKRNTNAGACIIFTEAIFGQGFSKQTIHRYFHKLVPKGDYDRSEKRAILADLEKKTKPRGQQEIAQDSDPLKRFTPNPIPEPSSQKIVVPA